MNYIRHLTTFYEKLAQDNRLNPNHVSLYLALFQCWNMNLFANPFSINRIQVLTFSKIGSNHTYYNALKDLCDWGYIHYEPSFSPIKGSLINMCIFAQVTTENEPEPHLCKNDIATCADMHHDLSKNDTGSDAKMHSSENEKVVIEENTQTQNSETMNTTNQSMGTNDLPRSKKGARKKENNMEPPNILSVTTYFQIEEFPEVEAQKFFNHYQSNGWKVGGKAPMKDWHAAARNWMLNSHNFKQPSRPGPYSRQQNNTKNYGEPL